MFGSTVQFDYIEFGSKYRSLDLHDLDNVCRSTEQTGLSTKITIDRNPKDWIAQLSIVAGFQGILLVNINTVRKAKEWVRAVKLPTERINGFVGTC